MEGAVATANELKKINPDAFVVFVGGHVSALPRETIKLEKAIDVVCQNEGVYARALCEPQSINSDSLAKIDGICYCDIDGHIVTNKASKIVAKKDLETILLVLLGISAKFDKYRTADGIRSNNAVKTHSLHSTQSWVPYRCSFCMINIINRTNAEDGVTSEDSNIFRWWSPEFIINQFDYFAHNGVKNVKIADELFVLNPRHFERVCDLIIKRV